MITPFEIPSPLDGTRLTGVTYTPDHPVAVLNIVHGFGEHCGRYAGMMDHLGQHGIASAALDVRGHGQSEGKRGVCQKYDALHSDVEALLAHSRETFPDVPHILFGHSMGGGLVLHYILKKGPQNQAGVIASAPLLTLTKPIPKSLEKVMRLLRVLAPNLTVQNKISGEEISTLPEERAAYENDALNHDRLGVGLGIDMFDAGRWVLKNAENWPLPALLLHARKDKLTAFEGTQTFSEKAPHCEFMIFDDAEHEMHNDQSRSDVYSAIIKFVEDRL